MGAILSCRTSECHGSSPPIHDKHTYIHDILFFGKKSDVAVRVVEADLGCEVNLKTKVSRPIKVNCPLYMKHISFHLFSTCIYHIILQLVTPYVTHTLPAATQLPLTRITFLYPSLITRDFKTGLTVSQSHMSKVFLPAPLTCKTSLSP